MLRENLLGAFQVDVSLILLEQLGNPNESGRWTAYVLRGNVGAFLVANFMLGGGLGDIGWETICLHYVVPIMTLLDWLLFDPKGSMKKTDPLIWPLSMIVYFIFVMVMVYVFGVSMGSTLNIGSRFPYPFIDVDVLGVPQVALTAVIMIVAFVVLGYVLFALDRLLGKTGKAHD